MSVPDWRRGDHSRKYKSRHEAGYDYKWVKLRLVALKRDGYLCQACKPWPRPATDVDHIKPKAEGGEDRLDNLQSLCRECHTAKTTKENRSRGLPEYGADGWPISGSTFQPYSIPNGLRQSRIPVTLVCGPPASGKTTYVNQHRQPGDMVIDLDDYREAICGARWSASDEVFRLAMKRRDAALHSLAEATVPRCWFIATAATADERRAWRDALGRCQVHIVWASQRDCIDRIRSNPARAEVAESQVAAVQRWWAANA